MYMYTRMYNALFSYTYNNIIMWGSLRLILIINPLRMRSRVTVVYLSVCLCVCLLPLYIAAPMLSYRAQSWYQWK